MRVQGAHPAFKGNQPQSSQPGVSRTGPSMNSVKRRFSPYPSTAKAKGKLSVPPQPTPSKSPSPQLPTLETGLPQPLALATQKLSLSQPLQKAAKPEQQVKPKVIPQSIKSPLAKSGTPTIKHSPYSVLMKAGAHLPEPGKRPSQSKSPVQTPSNGQESHFALIPGSTPQQPNAVIQFQTGARTDAGASELLQQEFLPLMSPTDVQTPLVAGIKGLTGVQQGGATHQTGQLRSPAMTMSRSTSRNSGGVDMQQLSYSQPQGLSPTKSHASPGQEELIQAAGSPIRVANMGSLQVDAVTRGGGVGQTPQVAQTPQSPLVPFPPYDFGAMAPANATMPVHAMSSPNPATIIMRRSSSGYPQQLRQARMPNGGLAPTGLGHRINPRTPVPVPILPSQSAMANLSRRGNAPIGGAYGLNRRGVGPMTGIPAGMRMGMATPSPLLGTTGTSASVAGMIPTGEYERLRQQELHQQQLYQHQLQQMMQRRNSSSSYISPPMSVLTSSLTTTPSPHFTASPLASQQQQQVSQQPPQFAAAAAQFGPGSMGGMGLGIAKSTGFEMPMQSIEGAMDVSDYDLTLLM